MADGPPDLPRTLGLLMGLGAAVALAGFGAVALDLWPGLRNGPRELDSVVSEIFLGFQAAKSR